MEELESYSTYFTFVFFLRSQIRLERLDDLNFEVGTAHMYLLEKLR
jgi:hypothetical protein